MRYLPLIVLFAIVSCKQKGKVDSIHEPGQVKSFMVYNAFDSMLVQMTGTGPDSICFIIGQDTVPEKLPLSPNYIYVANDTGPAYTLSLRAHDLLYTFINTKIPEGRLLIPAGEIMALKNYREQNAPINWRKYLGGHWRIPDSVEVLEDDFDGDGQNEIMLKVYAEPGIHEPNAKHLPQFSRFSYLEQTGTGYEMVYQHFLWDPPYLGPIVYDTISKLFMSPISRGSSCHEHNIFETWRYHNRELIFGPEFCLLESTCIDETDTSQRDWYYFGEVSSRFAADGPNRFTYYEHFELLSRNANGSQQNSGIFEKTFTCRYIFDPGEGKFKKCSSHAILPMEEEYYAESDRLLHLCKDEILYLKKHGPPAQRAKLKDFDYFD